MQALTPVETKPKTNADESSQDENKIFATNVVTALALSDDIFTNRKKKRDLDLFTSKLSATITSATEIQVEKVLIRSFPEVWGKTKIQGHIIAVEVPLGIIRNFNTFLLTKSNSSNFKNDYDAFISSDATLTLHKKLLKNTLNYIMSLAVNLMSSKLNEGKSSNKSSQAKNALASPNQANSSYRPLLYVYSIVDDQLDIVQINLEHLSNLRGI